MSDSDLRPLFHIIDAGEWETAKQLGSYRAASLDTEGFMHCSFAGQVRATLARHYPGRSGLLVLELDPARIAVPVRVEFSPASGDSFPHVYGPVPVDAVTAVHEADAWISPPGGPVDAASPDR